MLKEKDSKLYTKVEVKHNTWPKRGRRRTWTIIIALLSILFVLQTHTEHYLSDPKTGTIYIGLGLVSELNKKWKTFTH